MPGCIGYPCAFFVNATRIGPDRAGPSNGTGTHHARLTLRSPVSLDVPLDQIAQGEKFYIQAQVQANAYNGMQGESGITVWLQDPVTGQAMESSVEGAEPIPVPEPEPAIPVAQFQYCRPVWIDGELAATECGLEKHNLPPPPKPARSATQTCEMPVSIQP